MIAAAEKRPKSKGKQVPAGCFSPDKVPKEWRKLLKLLPGFDPFAQARGCFFDPAAAQHVIDFFHKCLRHIEGRLAGKPFILEPWQQAIVANLFGWKRFDRHGRIVRRFRELFLYVPRKNGNTPFCAGLCLYLLVCDNEPGAQIISAAANEGQASKLYRQAVGMVDRSPALTKRCRIYKGRGALAIQLRDDPGSAYQCVASSPKGHHGGTPHAVLVDELHAIDDEEMLDTFETSFASDNRLQPMEIFITTADHERVSRCNQKLAKARRVIANNGNPDEPGWDPQMLPVVYETAPGADWKDLKIWKAANPNFDISVSVDYAERKIRESIEDPTKLTEVLRLNLNTVTQSDAALLDPKLWDEMKGPIDESELKNLVCCGGLDLSSSRDLTAFVMLFRLDSGKYYILPRIWCPQESARERQRRDSVPYLSWIESGWIIPTDGRVTDYARVRADVIRDAETFGLSTMAIDRLFQGDETAQFLMAQGIDVVSHGQGFYGMAAPTKRFTELFYTQQFQHNGNPAFRWMIGNVIAETDAAGNQKPSKEKSKEKIDGVVSAIMALSCQMETQSQRESVYESRGLVILGGGDD